MFGAEPQEGWNQQDVAEFERYASMHFRRCVVSAVRAAVLLLVSIFCLLPFTAGHSLNKYWNLARVLVYVTLATFLWFFYKIMLIWSSWQSSRETRREFGDPR
jgi:hypothetical protein